MGYEVSGSGCIIITAANCTRAMTDANALAAYHRYTNAKRVVPYGYIVDLLMDHGFEVSGPDGNGDWEIDTFEGKWRDQNEVLQAVASFIEGSMDFTGEDGEGWTIEIKNGVLDSYNPKAENEAALDEYKELVSAMFASGSTEVMDWVIKRGLESKSRVIKEHIRELMAASTTSK